MKNKLSKKILISVLSCSALASAALAAFAIKANTGGGSTPSKPVVVETIKLNNNVGPNDIKINDINNYATAINTSSVAAKVNFSFDYQKEVDIQFTLQYRTGGGSIWNEWKTVPVTGTTEVDLASNYKIQFRAKHNSTVGTLNTETTGVNIKFSTPDTVGNTIALGGNAMSLLCTKFAAEGEQDECLENLNPTSSQFCFRGLFSGSTEIDTVPQRFLPSTTVATRCYEGMFRDCSGLTTAPALSATELATECYKNMFKGCVKLNTAPNLPAQTLAEGCYISMFDGCESLSSISLEYVGNFIAKYFSNWVNNVNKVGVICYNGSDTDRSSSEVPTNFNIVQSDYFKYNWEQLGYKKFEFSVDTASAKFKNNKTKLTWFCPKGYTTKITDILDDGQISVEPKYAQQATERCYFDPVKNEDISEETVLPNWPSKTVISYGFNPNINKNYTNIYSPTSAITIRINRRSSKWTNLFYKLPSDNTWTAVGNKTTITIPAKTNYYFYGDIRSVSESDYTNLVITGKDIHLAGSIMSLLSTDGKPAKKIDSNYCFCNLFKNSTGITDVTSDFLLPSTTSLSQGCFDGLFEGCKKLTSILKLPQLSEIPPYSFKNMFKGCTSLGADDEQKTGATLIPKNYLPATKVNVGSYQGMFQNCTSLEQAPNLPASSLGDSCYREMFSGCTNLENIPTNLDATTVPDYAYYSMFQGCIKITATPIFITTDNKKNWITYGSYSCQNMFRDCSSLVQANPIPLNTFGGGDSTTSTFESMFQDCTSLVTPAHISFLSNTSAATPKRGYHSMFKGCTSLCVWYHYWVGAWSPYSEKDEYCFFSTSAWAFPGDFDNTWTDMFLGCSKRDDETPESPTGYNAVLPVKQYYYSSTRATTSININKKTLTLNVGKTERLTVTAQPYGASNAVTWSSDNPTAVSVDSDGYVTAKKPNSTAVITAKSTKNTSLTATCTVSTGIPGPTTMTITGSDTIAIGSTEKYTANFTPVQDEVEWDDLQLTVKGITWNKKTGELTADEGAVVGSTVTISGHSKNYPTVGATKTITVTSVPVVLNNIVKATNTGTVATTLTYSNDETVSSNKIYYSTDGETWEQIFTGGTAKIDKGKSIYIRGDFSNGLSTEDRTVQLTFSNNAGEANIELSGSIMGLLDNGSKEFKMEKIPCNDCFKQLFSGSTALKSVSSDFLPATGLTDNCYNQLFYNCKYLTSAPLNLPAEQLTPYCYSSMFEGCQSLATGPTELKAETLAEYCYASMFKQCFALTTTPDIKATTYAWSSCDNMFYMGNAKASKLTTAKLSNSITSVASHSMYKMFYQCAKLTTVTGTLPSPNAEYCYSQMFFACESLTTPPIIVGDPNTPVSPTETSCMLQMFANCTSLHIYTTEGEGRKLFFYAGTATTATEKKRWLNMFMNVYIDDVQQTTTPTYPSDKTKYYF